MYTDSPLENETSLARPASLAVITSAVYFALFIIRPWELMVPSLEVFKPERTIGILILLMCFAEGRTRLSLRWQTITVWLFAFSVFLSCAMAENSSLAMSEFYKYATLLVFHLVLLVVIRSPNDLLFLLGTYMVAMFLYLAKAEWEFYINGHYQFRQGVTRMVGIEVTFGSANAFAASAVLSLPLWGAFYTKRDKLFSSWNTNRRSWLNWMMILYLLMVFVAVFESKSRTGAVGCLLAVALFVYRLESVRAKLWASVAMAFFIAVVSLQLDERDWVRLSTIVDSEAGTEVARESTQGRVEGVKSGLAIFKEYPVLGVGLANFPAMRARLYDGSTTNPHNLFAQILSELGMLGMCTFLLMLISTILACNKAIRYGRRMRCDDSEVFARFAAALKDTLFVLLLFGVTGHNLIRFQWYWASAFAIGLLAFQKQTLLAHEHDYALHLENEQV